MDTKAAFEKYAASNGYVLTAADSQYWSYINAETEIAWQIWEESWKQSRAAIEIYLPGQENYDDPLSAHLAIKDCAEAITSHGIRIKGKTE